MSRNISFLLALAFFAGCGEEEKPAATPASAPRTSSAPDGGASAKKPQPPAPVFTGVMPRIIITQSAGARLRELMKDHPGAFLRVDASGNNNYAIGHAPKAGPTDLLTESGGFPVVIERRSAAELGLGLQIDFDSKGGPMGFIFRTLAAAPGTPAGGAAPAAGGALADARRGFVTNLARRESAGKPAPQPPPNAFRLIRYPSTAGQLSAYITPNPNDGGRRPAIIWITGGDCNTIDDVWEEGPPENDQSATPYRRAGVVMMFPSLRGGNDNPGVREGFLGEVDDVLAAADYLAKVPYVDPSRIYLGGHSTGGTLALLTAECSDRFRAVFSFGPLHSPSSYPREFVPFNTSDQKEVALRAPILWLQSIRSPVFVFEGTDRGNLEALRAMSKQSTNANARFLEVKGSDHFRLLAPMNRLIAQKIRGDSAPTCNISFTEDELTLR